MINFRFQLCLLLSLALVLISACTPDKTKKELSKASPAETNELLGQKRLDQLKTGGAAALDIQPIKIDPDSKTVKTDLPKFPKGTSEFYEYYKTIAPHLTKLKYTDGEQIPVDKQGHSRYDEAKDLFESDHELIENLAKLKMSAVLTVTPWSSDYWAIAKGITSFRYADPDLAKQIRKDTAQFEGKVKARTAIDYYSQVPKRLSEAAEPGEFQELHGICKEEAVDRSRLLQCMNAQEKLKLINLYSPAEKYDILVGDMDFTLTRDQKQQTVSYIDKDGFVQMWMGICHGWAPAAYEVAAPQKSVIVTAADGETKIQFFADDIKALSVLKWASSRFKTRFVGGRCNVKEDDIEKHSISGKLLNDKCLDNGPDTWHVAIANKIGIQNQSFVMDATFDYEVWNQPVVSYKATYFNVKTMRLASTLKEATVSIADIGKKDRFYGQRKLDSNRNGRPTHLVGIQMDVTYIGETNPVHGKTRPPHKITVQYTYDLELDANNNILGGEWYDNNHPDFLWTPYANAKPENGVDRAIRNFHFDGENGHLFAKDLRERARKSLAELSQNSIKAYDRSPLAAIVDGLIEKSK